MTQQPYSAAPPHDTSLPIGIFDSGVGGLTVLSALLRRLPGERFCYLGDTARLPYGTKGTETIVRYSLQASAKLVERRIKCLVVACNTASAAALPQLQQAYPHIPVIGVVEPGAAAACAASTSGNILVLATESTIRGGAYVRAIKARRPEANVTGIACSLFVALAEEGWMQGQVAEAIAARYLEPVLRLEQGPDCAVLACTHFPPLAGAFQAILGNDVRLVDSAATTAEAVAAELARLGLLRPVGASAPDAAALRAGLHFLTTDAPERFARAGSLFLGFDLAPEELELVTL